MNAVDSSNILFIRLLGVAEVECAGEQVELTLPQKGIALLAYLVLNPNRPQPRQKLADLLWPDLPEEAGRSNLRQILLGVKRFLKERELGSSCIESDRNTIHFKPSDQCSSDIAVFLNPLPECQNETSRANCSCCLMRLESIANLYRARLLDDFVLNTCPEFEEWLQSQRERLLQREFYLLEKLSGCFEAQRNYDRALVYATAFYELAPWKDIALRRVIRLAALNGQRGFALSQYEDFCRTIKAELGETPEAETQKLAQRIQTGKIRQERQTSQGAPVVFAQPTQDAERRQVTICYCHFVTLDEEEPEDEFQLLKMPQARCREILRAHQGYVDLNLGRDCILAYFGYPKALEDSAVFAAHAALKVMAESFPGIILRIGIHTGLVLSNQAPDQPDMVGRASGLARSLSGCAADRDIVISSATHQLLSGYFECADLGPREFIGQSTPVNCFTVQRSRGASDRLDRTEARMPLVGRKREMVLLKRLWSASCWDKGQALLLLGEPGIGKSRLLRSLQQTLADQPCRCLELRCASESSSSPFQPIINLLNSLFGFLPTDSAPTRGIKLRKILEEQFPDQVKEILPLIAEMLALPLSSPYQQPRVSSQLQREQTRAILLNALHTLHKDGPILLIIEDLHWIDPTTLEMVTQLIEGGVPDSVLLLMTARPEFNPPWAESLVARLTVAALNDDEIGVLITAASPGISAELLCEVVTRADGIPLFAEELSRIASTLPSLEDASIPASLQDLLAARLDKLAEDKQLAQLAATIGRDFSTDLLAELSPLGRHELVDALYNLKNQGILARSAAGRWQFRHGLIRDAAYLSQVRNDRQWTHHRIAKILENGFHDGDKMRPELLAHHWSSAGDYEPAVHCWNEAGRLAQKSCAQQEAISHFKAGLALLVQLPQKDQKRLELQLQIGLGVSSYAAEGYASPSGEVAFNRAVELGELGDEGLQDLFPALWGLWAGASSYSSWKHSLQLAKRLLRIARHSKDPVQLQQGHFAMGNIEFWRGKFVVARKHLEQAKELYVPQHHSQLVAHYGENAFVTSGSYLSWDLCLLGFPDQALAAGQRAVEEARRGGHSFSLGYALTFYTVLHRMVRDPVTTLALAEETIALAAGHGFPLWEVGARLIKGWAKTVLGDSAGLVEMQRSVDQVSSLMSGITLIFLETQADGLCHSGQFYEALAVIDNALKLGAQLDDHHTEAELYRLKGVCLLALSNDQPEDAENCFLQALKISHQQRALLPELRAAVALAQLWAEPEKTSKGRTLVTEVYLRFTEGFDTADLCAAREQLDLISS